MTHFRFSFFFIALGMAWPALSLDCKADANLPIPSDSDLNAIAAMLPADPQGVGRPISDRAAWAIAAKQAVFQKQERDAARYLHEPIPVLTDDLFNEVVKDGRRDTYEQPAHLRTTRLVAFVVAECIENQGKYLPAIEAELKAILDEKTWGMPGQILMVKPFGGNESIDLASSVRAWNLATADYWLGDKLQASTRQRIRDEMRRRIFANYEDAVKTGKPHWFWMTANMNWNAVCTSGVLGAALAILPDPKERALFVYEARASMTDYLTGFETEGYDSEGLGYWNYGFGSYLCLSETLYQATQGKISLFQGDKLRQVALFPRHFEIVDGIFPAFSDSGVPRSHGIGPTSGSGLLLLINQRWGMGWTDIDPAKNDMFATHPLGDRLQGFGLFGFPLPVYDGTAVTGSPAPPDETAQGDLRYYFKQAGVLITRSTRPGAARLGLAIKGGENVATGHGHADNGAFVVACNGEGLISTPGMENYTAKSFGPHRFESMYANSYGQDVPYVNDTMQTPRTTALGKILSTDFTEDKDTLVMDLTSSYAVPALTKLTRTFVLDRQKPAVEITDEATFSQPTKYGSALVTVWDWKKEAPGVFLFFHGNAAVRATVTVDQGSVIDKAEPIVGFSPLGAHPPLRIGLSLEQPVSHVVMHTEIVPADPPPAVTSSK
jgi:hypothetical protein